MTQTINEFLQEWLDLSKRNLGPNTTYVYGRYLKMLASYLPDVPFDQIGRKDAEIIINKLLESYKPSTTAVCRRILATAYNRAIDWEIIEKNPFSKIRIKKDQTQHSIWTAEEVQRFLTAARYKCLFNRGNWNYYIAFLIAVYTGCRKSEILGLRWENVNLTNRTIHIKESLHETHRGGKKYVGTTKTKASNRQIALSNALVEELAEHKQRHAAGGKLPPDDYVIVTKDFKPIHQRNLTKAMRSVIESEGLPRIRFHDLRHTHASLMLANGINVKLIQTRLGHSRIDTTLNTYSKVYPDAQQEAADLFDEIL